MMFRMTRTNPSSRGTSRDLHQMRRRDSGGHLQALRNARSGHPAGRYFDRLADEVDGDGRAAESGAASERALGREWNPAERSTLRAGWPGDSAQCRGPQEGDEVEGND